MQRKTQKNNKKLGTDEVYHILREKLTSFQFKPGQSLSEKDIATQLQVSRTPVRHALFRLEKHGLVEIISRKGAFIKFLSMKDILEIFQVRKALEGLAARLAARNIDLEELKEYENYYLDFLNRNLGENHQEIFNFGVSFHDFIIRSASNKRVERILKDFRIQLEISRIFWLNQEHNIEPSRATESIQEHLEIIEALKKRDGELAEKQMKKHISNAVKHTLSFQEAFD